MKMKIVADSSANLLALPDIDFGIVPLHVIVGENDYVDDDKINLTAMQEDLSSYKGKTSTSSPSPHEWENAFGDADVVFCITITSTLSGTYNSAVIAKDIYEQHPGRCCFSGLRIFYLFIGSADFCHCIHIIYRHEMGAVGVDVS